MRDARSGVVLALVALLMVGLLIALPVTMTKVLVMVGIVAGLSIVSCLRSIDWVRLTVLACFLVVLLLPMIVRTSGPPPDAGASRQVVIITPHNEQIRTEFADAFERLHLATYDEPVEVVWNVPGGTSEIRRMLQAQATAALKEGRPVGGDADLVFGGGSYEHGELKKGPRPVTVEVDGETVTRHASITAPANLEESELLEIYGQREIAGVPLWDVDHHWYGTALSAFGLIYNRDALEEISVPEPTGWDALVDPRLQTWVALVNPNQSGSITTAFETILERRGWDEGWAILRRASANARDFSASSLKAPTDVSQGDAAIGVCIDFFGRFQSQAILDHGGGDRVAYVDPPGDTKLDPDPISLLAGAPDPELAKRFIRFVLMVQGQSLWQFDPAANSPDGLGPTTFALRRLPVRRELYARYSDRMMDRIDPYADAREPEFPDRAMRSFIAPLFGAMSMDTHVQLIAAWNAIVSHPSYPSTPGLVTADMVDDPQLKAMLEAFDAMPEVLGPDGEFIALGTPEGRAVVKAGWLRRNWSGKGLWPADAEPGRVLRQQFSDFFTSQYMDIAASVQESDHAE